MNYYLGIDNGGTTIKAALYDRTGREIAVVSRKGKMIAPAPDITECDMDRMWEMNCEVIRGVLETSGISPEDIAGVAVCGHGKGLYLWGKNGRPVRNGILSMDNRAYAYVRKWQEDGTEDEVFALSCQHIMTCQPVALLAWLKDNEPEIIPEIQWIFECKDYTRFRLTGEAKAELTDYSGANFVNLHTAEYDRELLGLFGLADLYDALPPLIRSTDLAGYVTEEAAMECGLKAGTPVFGGMFDIDACAVAAGVLDEENICVIAGTWSINEYPRRTPVTDGSVRMNSYFCLPGYYLIEESSSTSAGNNEWFINTLLPEEAEAAKQAGQSIYDVMNGWVSSLPPEEFVPLFLPFLMGSNVHPNAKGAFVGLSASHTRAHLARSVYEGIVYCHLYHMEKLLATRDSAPGCVRLAGGAAKSEVWSQMFADILNLPVERVDVNETGALGCAITAAAGCGDYPSLSEAAKTMSPSGSRLLPDENAHACYMRRYALYQKLIDCLDPLWDDVLNCMS